MARRTGMARRIETAAQSRMKYLEEDFGTAVVNAKKEFFLEAHDPCHEYDELFPDDKQLPDEGGWVQVQLPPHCDVSMEPLSIWYALPVQKEKEWEFQMMKSEKHDRYKIKILTPIGEVMLYPSEYTVVNPETLYGYMKMLGAGNSAEDHVAIEWMDPRNEHFDTDRLFYIMARGITRADAYIMLMGEVKSANVCYFTFHEEYQRIFAGVGISSLAARSRVNGHIDFVNQEKAAGRWYNPEWAKQQREANEQAEAAAAGATTAAGARGKART